MEQETILYYYPMPEQLAKRENRYAAKRHWFQDAALQTACLGEQAEFQVLGCAIPPFYYRRRPWKPQTLSALMETVLSHGAGMTDTWIHPGTAELLTDAYRMKWTPREGTVWTLVRHLLDERARKTVERCGMVTVLLGRPADRDRQMEMTWELLQPFLPRVNRMLLYYERQEEDSSFREEDLAGQEEWNGYLEQYYYEYGLVVQPEAYLESRTAGTDGIGSKQPGSRQLRCGRAKCGGLILDYGEQFRYPGVLPEGGIYIDIASAGQKEEWIRRKGLPIPYRSPMKYLDTMVKNSYDS